MKEEKLIPIFYTCDDNSAKSTINSVRSIIDNLSAEYSYAVCILHTGINKSNMKKMFELGKAGVNITLEDVSYYLSEGGEVVSFSPEFIRSFIVEMYPGYDRSMLVNSDYVASGDISSLYESAARGSVCSIGC